METARGQGIGPMRPMGPMSMVRSELLVLLADAQLTTMYVRDKRKRGGISPSLARSVLLVLAAYEGRSISRGAICERCGISLHTCTLCMQALIKHGYIVRTNGIHALDGHRYYLISERLTIAAVREPLVRANHVKIRYHDERHVRDRERQRRRRMEEKRRETGRQIGHA